MRNRLTKLATSLVAFIAAAFMTVLATSTLAQKQGRPVYVPPALARRETEMARERQMRETEDLRKGLGKRPVKLANVAYIQAVIAQVKQDFERIQTARNKIVRATSNGNAVDYKFISEVAGEIKKRASRLEGNLALPEPEGDEKSQKGGGEKSQENGSELNEEQVRAALSTLCNRIESFVKSPLFETPGVIDVQHSANASRDLESMLQLSASIRRSADRLNKAVARP